MAERKVLLPRESGELIASQAKDVKVDALAAAECAEYIYRRAQEDRHKSKSLFKDTPVHPQV